MTFEYSKCEPIENELAQKLVDIQFSPNVKDHWDIEAWLEVILNKICDSLSIDRIMVFSTPENCTYLGLYKEGNIYVDYSMRTAKEFLVVGLHELAHHLEEKGGIKYRNEIEYNGKDYRLFHGDGFCKALRKVYSLY